MNIIANASRMWLTRSPKPFQFKNEYDQHLDYLEVQHLGLYIHLPFCKNLCSFCPYCKVKYEEKKCNEYIDSLLLEIEMVGRRYKEKKEVTSLYFGGGTPALAISRLAEIIQMVETYFIIQEGIGLELHPENVTTSNLTLLKNMGITKISIGIQSFQDKFLTILGRNKVPYETMWEAIAQVPFETVSMDFIFALPHQSIDDLQKDIDIAFANGANHIAIYPFIDFSFTHTKIPPMKKQEKRKLLDEITIYCLNQGYSRDSIWTFSSTPEAKYSSMTRDNFLGFGCSATTLLHDQFKINTFSIEEYCNRIMNKQLPTSLTLRFSERQRMVYYLFWTAYSTQVSASDFEHFFSKSLKKSYGLEFWIAKKLGFITESNGVYTLSLKGAFYYHYYEHYYTLSYIDKMWGIMRKDAFPKELHF